MVESAVDPPHSTASAKDWKRYFLRAWLKTHLLQGPPSGEWSGVQNDAGGFEYSRYMERQVAISQIKRAHPRAYSAALALDFLYKLCLYEWGGLSLREQRRRLSLTKRDALLKLGLSEDTARRYSVRFWTALREQMCQDGCEGCHHACAVA